MINKFLVALLAIVPLVAHAELPIVENAFIAPTPPGAKVGAAFMTFRNNGSEAINITEAMSPDIKKVEIHLSRIVDDVATMKKQDNVQVAAGGTVAFKHGGYHFMLMGLTSPLVEGDVVPLMITTSAGMIHIDVPVGKAPMKTDHDSSHSSDHGKEHEMNKGAEVK